MAEKNFNLKVNNLGLSTNMDNLLDSKSSIGYTYKKNLSINPTSPKGWTYKPIQINNYQTGVSNGSSIGKNYYNNVQRANSKIMMKSSNSNGIPTVVNNLNNQVRFKTEVETDNNLRGGGAFSPKATKNSQIGSGNNQRVTVSRGGMGQIGRYIPMSTRNTNSTQNTFVSKGENQIKEMNGINTENNQEMVNVMSLLGNQNNVPISMKNLNAAILIHL